MKTLLTVLLLGLGLPACRTREAARPGSGRPDPMLEVPGDPAVEGDLEMLDARMSASGKLGMLEFGLRNKSSAELPFAWTLEWYDRTGARIAGSARAWNSMTLDPGESRAVQVPVPSPEASSWRLRAVRPGSNTHTQGVSR